MGDKQKLMFTQKVMFLHRSDRPMFHFIVKSKL